MHPRHIKLIKTLVALAAADLIRVGRINRKRFKRNLEKLEQANATNELLQDLLKTSMRRTEYLARMLDENDVPITEFDAIVYNSLI
jgi:hypothetical protein